MGNHLGTKMIAAITAMRLGLESEMARGSYYKPSEASATGKPPRDRAKIKAARKQNRRRRHKRDTPPEGRL